MHIPLHLIHSDKTCNHLRGSEPTMHQNQLRPLWWHLFATTLPKNQELQQQQHHFEVNTSHYLQIYIIIKLYCSEGCNTKFSFISVVSNGKSHKWKDKLHFCIGIKDFQNSEKN